MNVRSSGDTHTLQFSLHEHTSNRLQSAQFPTHVKRLDLLNGGTAECNYCVRGQSSIFLNDSMFSPQAFIIFVPYGANNFRFIFIADGKVKGARRTWTYTNAMAAVRIFLIVQSVNRVSEIFRNLTPVFDTKYFIV